jgi:hypothetical protein
MTTIDKKHPRTYLTNRGQRVVCIPIDGRRFSLEYIDDEDRVVKCRELPLKTVEGLATLGKWEKVE